MTKMTYVQAIDFAVANIDNAEVIEKLEALKVQLAKRSGGKRGMTTTQKANVGIKETIVDVLAEKDNPATVTELIADERLHGFTNQKISALLRQLVDENKVTKSVNKKKSYFALA